MKIKLYNSSIVFVKAAKNLFDKESFVWEQGNIVSGADDDTIKVFARTKGYTEISGITSLASISGFDTNVYSATVYYYDANKTYISPGHWLAKGTVSSAVINRDIPQNAKYMRVRIGKNYPVSYDLNDIPNFTLSLKDTE